MDVLTIDNRNFVKASAIARELGYTSDYVGQLCRSGKVDAKLVGRTWYVERESIRSHKENRYKKEEYSDIVERGANSMSTKPKEGESQSQSKKTSGRDLQFYRYNSQLTNPQYKEDTSDLIPSPRKDIDVKTGRLTVGLADANSVKINSESSKYKFTAPTRPKIAFEGEISVADVPEVDFQDESSEPEEKTHSKPEQISITKIETRGGRVNFRKKLEQVESRTDTKNLESSVLTVEREGGGSRISGFLIITTTVAALVLTITLVGIEAHVVSTQEAVLSTKYLFAMEKLLASVYGSI